MAILTHTHLSAHVCPLTNRLNPPTYNNDSNWVIAHQPITKWVYTGLKWFSMGCMIWSIGSCTLRTERSSHKLGLFCFNKKRNFVSSCTCNWSLYRCCTWPIEVNHEYTYIYKECKSPRENFCGVYMCNVFPFRLSERERERCGVGVGVGVAPPSPS